MRQPPYTLDAQRRRVALESILKGCAHRGWAALAVHVRESHVHVVIEVEGLPEPVMTDLKAYASHGLNETGLDAPGRRRWARHGSTRRLWTPKQVQDAIGYVIDGQGVPMETFRGASH
jgi:REP element-mobilizing transposase RayT